MAARPIQLSRVDARAASLITDLYHYIVQKDARYANDIDSLYHDRKMLQQKVIQLEPQVLDCNQLQEELNARQCTINKLTAQNNQLIDEMDKMRQAQDVTNATTASLEDEVQRLRKQKMVLCVSNAKWKAKCKELESKLAEEPSHEVQLDRVRQQVEELGRLLQMGGPTETAQPVQEANDTQ